MTQVPKNKTVYIGGRRYLEGEILPPHAIKDQPVLTKKKAGKKSENEKRSRRGKSTQRKIY